jgi:hypothetical protein
MIRILSTFLFLFLAINLVAQVPQSMSYQAVIRNSSNVLITSTTVGMQISILKGSSNGTPVYVETQKPSGMPVMRCLPLKSRKDMNSPLFIVGFNTTVTLRMPQWFFVKKKSRKKRIQKKINLLLFT